MRNKTCLTICFIIQATFVLAQDSIKTVQKKNTVFIELFGSSGLFYNLTYDRTFVLNHKNKLSAGLGVQFFPDPYENLTSITPQINYIRGRKNCLELGLGLIYSKSEDFLVPNFRIGYRHQKPEGGMFYKVAITPMYLPDFFIYSDIMPWAGGAIGYTF